MKYVCLFFITIFIGSCVNAKKDSKFVPIVNIEDIVSNLPESITEATEKENNAKGTVNQYTFEFYNDTYYDMNDLTYFLADTSINSLRLYGGTFSDLSPLAELRDLEELGILANEYITDISPIGSLVNLKRLTLFNVHNMKNIEVLSSLVNLEYLLLAFKDKYYKELLPMRRLEVLILYNDFPQELDVTYIAQLHSLKELEIHPGSSGLINIGELRNLVNLEKLTINYLNGVDISWLPHLQKLTELNLLRCTVDNISPLLELQSLVELNLHYSEIRDITPLLESRSIKRINGPIVLENNIGLYGLFRERGIEYYPHTSDR